MQSQLQLREGAFTFCPEEVRAALPTMDLSVGTNRTAVYESHAGKRLSVPAERC